MLDWYIKRQIIFFSIFVISIAFGFLWAKSYSGHVLSEVTLPPTPNPSQVPFAELTIPYLRNRSYNSNLSGYKKVAEYPNFTSYQTSYVSDGFKVNALLNLPKNDPPVEGWPAIIFVHGYIPPQNYQTISTYNMFINPISAQGIVVLKIDLRGHGQSEGNPGSSYYSSDYLIDTLNAYSALKKLRGLNPKNISLWGHSMAGNLVLRAILVSKSIPKAIIWAGAGYTYEDLQAYNIKDTTYQPPKEGSSQRIYQEDLFQTYGTFSTESGFWKQIPATNFLDGVTTQIQLHHAMDDSVVNISYSRNLSRILTSAGIINHLYEYRSGGHNISGASFNEATIRTINFVKDDHL